MIRDFRRSDQGVVRALVLAGLRERWGDAFDDTQNPDLDDIAENYVGRGAEVVVAELSGHVVATGMLLFESPGQARIVRMSVAEDRRREGLGRCVVEELISRASLRDVQELRVLTDTPWASAIALYKSCGFVEVGRDQTDTHFAMSLGGNASR